MYSCNNWTYGVELEYGNCRYGSQLPDGASWNNKDNTCVSSTGIANDPDGILYQYGGEINTKPTGSIKEQVSHIVDINEILNPKPIVNYRSNLHIHIRVPGLKDDLVTCKQLLRYIDQYQQEAFDIVEQIPTPNKALLPPIVYEWELKRMKRRYKSHQYKLPKSRVDAMLQAKTTQEFFEEHATLTEKGRMWYFSPRAGINLRQMWEETETIEFRHFPGTLDPYEMESCITWCHNFLDVALNDNSITPRDIFYYSDFDYKFPKFQPYEFETEQVYQWTNFGTNKKSDIAKRIQALRDRIDIDDVNSVTSLNVYMIMLELKECGL